MAIILLALALTPIGAARAGDWITQLDIPLMSGLRVADDSHTVFETAAGRIVVITASGAVAPDAARRYYAAALAGLGWRATSCDAMVREDEKLEITVTAGDGVAVVAFRLSPNLAPCE